MKFIDLFCGCGGFSEGMTQAGHTCILAVDNWETALKSHEANHPEAEHWNKNILKIRPEELPKADFIIGSPPCPEFSTIGVKSGKGANTELLNHFIKLSEGFNIWIGENVSNAKHYLNGTKYQILYANNFYLYHLRPRVFFGEFPKVNKITKNPTHFPTPMARKGGNTVFVQTTISRRKTRDKCLAYPAHVAQWIMGFPKTYKVKGGEMERRQQVGNAVCPPVAKAIGEAFA